MSKAVEKIKKYMEDKGVNQAELAEALDITQGYVSMLIRNNTTPSVSFMQVVEDKLGVKKGDWFK